MQLDYNDAQNQLIPKTPQELSTERDKLRAALLCRLEDVLFHLFPAGYVDGRKFYIGNVRGDHGDSMDVTLDGAEAGLWSDFATGDGGDIFDLWAAARGWDARRDFPKLIAEITEWLGQAPEPAPRPNAPPKTPPMDDLGPHTGKWDYRDTQGNLIACVYRYDTPKGKEFRPLDVKARKRKAPDPRPLYNQPGIAAASCVVLVEGEKCADALIAQNICATTAMNGANAPVEKTDWSPLQGKQIVIWPDNDAPGMAYASRVKDYLSGFGFTVAVADLPPGKKEGWDAADAVDEEFDFIPILKAAFRGLRNDQAAHPASPMPIPHHSLREMLADTSPMPLDVIAPRVLTPCGFLVFGGAPKVGKSDFVLSWLMHMAAGVEFLGMRPPRPLRVFILQAEIQYHYLRERLLQLRIDPNIRQAALDNLVMTPQLRMLLNEEGIERVAAAIHERFPDAKPDIIVVDPLRNVFDGGSPDAHENDNNAMLFFLQKRVEALRDAVNPDAGIILVHHTSKTQKKALEEDPFRALSGAGSLRGYYTTGMLLYRPDESRSERNLYFELRNGDSIPFKVVDKKDGQWIEIDRSKQRIVRQDYSEKQDAERRRKHDVILQIIFDEATQGRVYTASQFAEVFENKSGLGGDRTIRNRLSVLASKSYVRYFQNATDYGLPKAARTKFGYLCVEDMDLQTLDGLKRVLPTHYKCPSDGVPLRVENPEDWNYHDDGDEP